jgi:2,6-dihydroxypyridine 3-monooxygenase
LSERTVVLLAGSGYGHPVYAAAGGNVPAALAAWERRQLALGHDLLARCRAIGDSSQFHGTFRPGDPRLIFGLYAPGD